MHILTLYNWYAASYALIMLSFLELVIVAWIYGNYHSSNQFINWRKWVHLNTFLLSLKKVIFFMISGNNFMISCLPHWIAETFQIGIHNSRKDFDPTGNAIRQKLRREERMKPTELFPLKCTVSVHLQMNRSTQNDIL